MEYVALQALQPTWSMQWLQLLVIDQAAAFSVDGVSSARAIAPADAAVVGECVPPYQTAWLSRFWWMGVA